MEEKNFVISLGIKAERKGRPNRFPELGMRLEWLDVRTSRRCMGLPLAFLLPWEM